MAQRVKTSSSHPTSIVGKKQDLGILDPVIFSGKIRKNRKKSEKYFLGKFFRKYEKKSENYEKNSEKYEKNSEKYFEKFGKIQVRPKEKKGPHSIQGKKFGKISKIQKNTENS